MERNLKMKFVTKFGKSRTISVKNCKEDVKGSDVAGFSRFVTEKDIVKLKDGDVLSALKSASIVKIEEQEIPLNDEEDEPEIDDGEEE